MRFVLIDRLIEIEPGTRAVASTRFSHDNEIFADHFPGTPLVPGVLVTEAMAQTAGWLIAATLGFERWPLLVMIERAKFRRLVRPDERLLLTATLRANRGDTFEADTEVRVGDDRVANARLVFRLFSSGTSDQHRVAFAEWAGRLFAELEGPAAMARRTHDGGH